MKSFQLLTLVATLTLALSACNEGSHNQSSIRQCPNNYNPIPMDLPPNQQKVSLHPKADGTIALMPGNYAYVSADLYYVDNRNAPKNYRLHVQDALQKDKSTFKTGVVCQRNSNSRISELQIDVTTKGISSLTIGADSKPAPATVKSFSFRFGERSELILSSATLQNEKPSDPSQGSPDPDSFATVTPTNPNAIDIRSTGQAKDQNGQVIGNWYLLIRFTRTDLK